MRERRRMEGKKVWKTAPIVYSLAISYWACIVPCVRHGSCSVFYLSLVFFSSVVLFNFNCFDSTLTAWMVFFAHVQTFFFFVFRSMHLLSMGKGRDLDHSMIVTHKTGSRVR